MAVDSASYPESNIDSMDFLLFLILILLLLGNQNTFNAYFQLFDQELDKLNQILGAFQATANGLKGVFANNKKVE